MMNYRRALKLQAFLDIATDIEISQGYKAVTIPSEEEKKSQKSLYAQLEALADLKFTYVATCQNYGNQKRSGDRRATDIFNLMVKNPALRVAYIDEVEKRQGGNRRSSTSLLILISGANCILALNEGDLSDKVTWLGKNRRREA
ncbi:callose synthase 5 [Tanacetum coccineum]